MPWACTCGLSWKERNIGVSSKATPSRRKRRPKKPVESPVKPLPNYTPPGER